MGKQTKLFIILKILARLPSEILSKIQTYLYDNSAHDFILGNGLPHCWIWLIQVIAFGSSSIIHKVKHGVLALKSRKNIKSQLFGESGHKPITISLNC